MTSWKKIGTLCAGITALAVPLIWQASFAGPLRERIIEHLAIGKQSEILEEDSAPGESMSLPEGIHIDRDIAYGSDELQRFDVYRPAQAINAPVIFMVHGGAWSLGDKTARAVVENKAAHWVPKGFILVSTNYRLLPKTDPLEQAGDVARALATAQDRAASWGGDRTRFILMGHSAGAHLVALLATVPSLSSENVTPWLGAVLLDSAAFDVVRIMQARHARFYDRAFGHDREYWKAASPFHALAGRSQPILAICSTRRADACHQANRFVEKAVSHGTRASVLKQDLTHKEINRNLGEEPGYTQAVESFLCSLDASFNQTFNCDAQ